MFGWGKKNKKSNTKEDAKKEEVVETSKKKSTATNVQANKVDKKNSDEKTSKASAAKNKKQDTDSKEKKCPKCNKVIDENEKHINSKTKKPIYRVVYDKAEHIWQIKKDGAKRVITSYPTKEEALARVKELSESNDLCYIVHKKDGKFQKK